MSAAGLRISENAPGPLPPPHRARVVLVSPHPLERAGLRALLERSGESTVEMELSDLSVLPPSAKAAPADVVLVDLDGGKGGADIVARGCAAWHGVPLLALVRHVDFERARQLVLAGARGVIAKDETAEHLVAAVRKVQEHELWLDRASVARLIDELSQEHATGALPEPDPRFGTLTERELEIVDLVAKGLCNKSIASRLAISDNTVRHHLTSIFAKLGVHDRLALAVHAMKHRR